MEHKLDKELDEFRKIMEVPSTFVEGFQWSALFGAIFVALLMVPGAIYMGLLAGTGIGSAAQWVTDGDDVLGDRAFLDTDAVGSAIGHRDVDLVLPDILAAVSIAERQVGVDA